MINRIKYFFTSNLLLPIFDGHEIHGGDGGVTTTSAPVSGETKQITIQIVFYKQM